MVGVTTRAAGGLAALLVLAAAGAYYVHGDADGRPEHTARVRVRWDTANVAESGIRVTVVIGGSPNAYGTREFVPHVEPWESPVVRYDGRGAWVRVRQIPRVLGWMSCEVEVDGVVDPASVTRVDPPAPGQATIECTHAPTGGWHG